METKLLILAGLAGAALALFLVGKLSGLHWKLGGVLAVIRAVAAQRRAWASRSARRSPARGDRPPEGAGP